VSEEAVSEGSLGSSSPGTPGTGLTPPSPGTPPFPPAPSSPGTPSPSGTRLPSGTASPPCAGSPFGTSTPPLGWGFSSDTPPSLGACSPLDTWRGVFPVPGPVGSASACSQTQIDPVNTNTNRFFISLPRSSHSQAFEYLALGHSGSVVLWSCGPVVLWSWLPVPHY